MIIVCYYIFKAPMYINGVYKYTVLLEKHIDINYNKHTEVAFTMNVMI